MKRAAYLAFAWGLTSMALAAAEEKPASVASAVSQIVTAAADTKPPASQAKAPVTPTLHWAYQPVKAPAIPVVKEKTMGAHADRRVRAGEIRGQGAQALRDADRALFIRRATLDVWGFIPTPDEIKAFVADRSPNAYQKLVSPAGLAALRREAGEPPPRDDGDRSD